MIESHQMSMWGQSKPENCVKKAPEPKTHRRRIWRDYSNQEKLEALHSCTISAHILTLFSPTDELAIHAANHAAIHASYPYRYSWNLGVSWWVHPSRQSNTDDDTLPLTILCLSPDKFPSVFQLLGTKVPRHLLRGSQPNCSLDRWRTFHFIWQEEFSFPRCICDVFRPEFSHCL